MGLETNKVTYKKSWELVRLKELCTRISDGTHFTPEYINEGIPFISVKDIYDEKVHFEKCKYISIEAHKELIKRCYPEKDDVLITKSGTIGRMALVPEKPEFSLFVSVALLKNKKQLIHSKFLKYCLENFLNHINIAQDIKGGLLKNFHLEDIRETLVPKITLGEQAEIINKIEELLRELENGKQQLLTAQQQLKVYRQSLLKWAFEGKLTIEWREKNKSIQNADELLKEIKLVRDNKFKGLKRKLKPITNFEKDELIKLPNIPKNWQWVKIVETVFNTSDDIVDGPFGSNLKNSDYVEGAPVPVISISNIEEGFNKKIRYITNEKFETIKRSAVHPGDIIVAKIGSTYGKTGEYPEWMPIGVIPANLLRVRPSSHYSKKLLIYYLKSAVFKKRLDAIMKSTAQPAYNVSMFKELPIPFMSIEEQQLIVDELESKLTVCDKIEETISQSLQQAETLKQSILKQAFEGKLITTEKMEIVNELH